MAKFIKYLLGRRKRRLYAQWVEMAELPPEETPLEETSSRPVREEERLDEVPFPLNTLTILYLMQGASLVLLCVILILLIVQAC